MSPGPAALLAVLVSVAISLAVFPAVSARHPAGRRPQSGQQGAGQVKAKTAESSLQYQVTVTLKLVQVFVTDAKGKPALDLEGSDFVLYDNGKLQTITDFEKHVLTLPPAERPASAPPTAGAAAPLLSRKFIFLIDFVRNDLEGIAKARKAALEFLDTKVQPGDEVALFSFTPTRGLTLYEYLTSDRGKVRTAISKLREIPAISPVSAERSADEVELMGVELLSQQIFGPHGGHAGAGARDLFAEVAEWAKSLRAIPGSKNIILFSRGFGAGVVRPGAGENALFEMMARALASANAPVFAVDTNSQRPPGLGMEAKLPSGVLAEGSLDHLSRVTGGKFLGAVDYSARIAEDIQDATGNYYVLGFYVTEAWDGKFHDIKVEVRRPGNKVYAQKGYFNPVPFDRLSPVEKHLHLLGLALGESASAVRNLDFPMTAVPFATGRAVNVLLLSELPVASIRNSVGDRTEFISLVLNQDNSIVDGKRVEINWKEFGAGTVYKFGPDGTRTSARLMAVRDGQKKEIDWSELGTGKVYQYGVIPLAPGRYDCRVVIRNLDDGRGAVGSCSVEVPELPAEAPVLFPPLLLVSGPEAPYLNVTQQAKGDTAEGASISSIFPFLGKEYAPLVGPMEQGQTSLCAVLRCVWRGDRTEELGLSAWLSTEGSDEKTDVPMSLLSSDTRDETDFYLLEFELPELAPGRYRLEIAAENMTTGASPRTAAWLTIRPPS